MKKKPADSKPAGKPAMATPEETTREVLRPPTPAEAESIRVRDALLDAVRVTVAGVRLLWRPRKR